MSENEYWDRRKDILYYQIVRVLASKIGVDANSILDVGSSGCPYLDWFDWIPNKTSLDINTPYQSNDVTSYQTDFLTWDKDQHYDVVLCLQVLEHIEDAKAFAQKLLSVGEVLIVSVPYKWPANKSDEHIHDPVDREKMKSWFGRDPNYEYICTEILAPIDRLIQVYDKIDQPWNGLKARQNLLLDKNKS